MATAEIEMVLNAGILVCLLITASTIILVADWRITLFALIVQYLVLAFFLSRLLLPAVATVRMVSGGLVGLILLLTVRGLPRDASTVPPRLLAPSVGFRLLVILLATIAILSLTSSTTFLGLPAHVLFGSIWLMIAGLLAAMLAHEAMPFGLGILAFTAGFSLLETAIEGSLFLYGLLNIADLLIALVVAHLATLPPEVEGGRRGGESA